MEINNVFSPVSFYANKRYWHSNKWYTYGQKCPIIMTAEKTLPFQLVVSPGVTLSSFTIKKADSDASVMTVNTAGNYFNIDAETYSIIQVKTCTISALPYGNYYYALTLSDGSTYISDIIAIISDMSKCIKITYKNVENLYFSSGRIDFTNDFVFELYLPTTIGKPEYEYEEELTKRLGYKFVESQVVNKVYKFTFPATEQLCDAYRFVRMCDYIRIDTYNPDFSDYDHYNVIYLSSEVEWLDNGDIASVETSFETDSIVQKLQDYSRTQLVNFYNALLSNSDEALKFDDETIAQYYSNYIQSIDGKMIRQLNAVSSISDNTVIAIDENNGTGAANKILLKPLLVNTVAEQLQASEVLANFQQHINNSSIHITAAERAVLSLFGVDDNGDVYVKGDKGFYTNSFVSAKGKSSSTGGGSGASALYQLVDVLANENNDGVQGATTNSVLMYNGTKWYAGTINAGLDEAALKAYLDANKYTTTVYVDSQVSTINNQITTINDQISAINSQLDTKVDKTDLDKKVDNAFFARVFGLLDANGNEIAVNDVATVADSIKAKFGLWTEQYISAKGKNSSGSGGGASALYQLVDVLANSANDGVQGATTNSVLMYNGTKWYAGTINTGLDEAALKAYLDANKYTTTIYVDSQISAINSQLDTKADKTALSAYLPLSGGTVTGDLTINGTIYVGKTNYVYHTGNLTGDNAWITLSSNTISHKTIHANNITLIASSGQFVTGYTVDKAGHIVSISQRALNASDIPSIAITQVTGLQDALDKKVDSTFFARVFGLLDSDGNEIAVNDVTTVADSVKAKFGLWTEQYISAKGKSSSTGGGGGVSALYQLVDVAPNSTNDGVLNAANGSVLMYNGSKWQAGNVVTDISPLTLNVNGSSLFTYDGKSSITANITVPTKVSQLTNDSGYLTAITKAQVEGVLTGNITSHTHDYLPLSGGSLSGALRIDCSSSQGNNYNEGIRCNLGGAGSWASVVIGGENGSTYGSGSGVYSLLVNSGLFRIRQNTTEVITINTSNNVGIGTTTPSYKLHTVGDIYSSTYLRAASGFIKVNSSDSYVLLGGGGHKLESSLSVSYAATAAALSSVIANDKLPERLREVTTSYSGRDANTLPSNGFYYCTSNINGLIDANVLQLAYDNSSWRHQLMFKFSGTTGTGTGYDGKDLWTRVYNRYSSSWTPWYRILTSGNYNSYAPTLTGIGASGTWGISITGNADTLDGLHASDFARSRVSDLLPTDINHLGYGYGKNSWYTYGPAFTFGVDSYYARIQKYYNRNTLYLGGYSTELGDLGWREFAFTDSNVASATKLQTARTIWGQSFDGTSNVDNILTLNYSASTRATGIELQSTSNSESSIGFTSNSKRGVVGIWGDSLRLWVSAYGDVLNIPNNSNGYVGIGTTSPSCKLDVNGTIQSTYYGPAFKINVPLAVWAYMDYSLDSKSIWHIGTTGSSGSRIGQALAFEIRDVSHSYDGISIRYGTSSYGKLVVSNSSGYESSIGYCNMESATVPRWTVGCDNLNFFWYYLQSGKRATLDAAGNFATTGAVTAKASSSDIRLKTDISDYKALSIIRSHKSIKYHWNAVAKANADIFNDDYWHYGLIAQDVQRDMPQMVSDVFKDYLVINYERLIPICWKGLQEVDDEVTKLKKKVRKLEMEIRELKQKEDRL